MLRSKRSSIGKMTRKPMLEKGDLNAFWNIKAVLIVLLMSVCGQAVADICVKSDDGIFKYSSVMVSYAGTVNDRVPNQQIHHYHYVKGLYLYFRLDLNDGDDSDIYKVINPSDLSNGDLIDVTGGYNTSGFHIVKGGCNK